MEKMKNNITDLNNHLFAELERLGDEELTGEALEKEITRAKAISDVSRQIIDSARTSLDAARLQAEWGGRQHVELPMMLENKKTNA